MKNPAYAQRRAREKAQVIGGKRIVAGYVVGIIGLALLNLAAHDAAKFKTAAAKMGYMTPSLLIACAGLALYASGRNARKRAAQAAVAPRAEDQPESAQAVIADPPPAADPGR